MTTLTIKQSCDHRKSFPYECTIIGNYFGTDVNVMDCGNTFEQAEKNAWKRVMRILGYELK